MADWAPKANYNNPLFTIYHTLQFAKYKGMYWGEKKKFTDYYGHECENTFGMPLVHHRAELAPGMLNMGCCFLVFCHPVSYCEVLPARFVTPACFTVALLNVPKNSFRARFVILFQQHCDTSFLFPRCVYRCA